MNKEAFMNPYVILSSVNYREVVEADRLNYNFLSSTRGPNPLGLEIN